MRNRKMQLVEDDEELFPPRKKVISKSKQKYLQPVKSDNIWFKGKLVPRTYGQEFYLNTLNESDITFCVGPAGCGKTWVATRVALERLADNSVSKIVVTKPILEAGGEKLGFLPGEVEDKITPHFQSVIDCFEDHVGPTVTKKLIDSGKIEFLPTAFCRGRDIKNSFILIDEAQNLTRKGIKLLLTRISDGSCMALNGDTDQCDLPNIADSGLQWAVSALRGKNSRIGIAEMTDSDIQRHPLIQVIVSNLR